MQVVTDECKVSVYMSERVCYTFADTSLGRFDRFGEIVHNVRKKGMMNLTILGLLILIFPKVFF